MATREDTNVTSIAQQRARRVRATTQIRSAKQNICVSAARYLERKGLSFKKISFVMYVRFTYKYVYADRAFLLAATNNTYISSLIFT